ncbi:MAG TPA: HAD family phosphatase [Candidatus Saccharimonadales bacterium]|nr:HAD family phosphatase [Candidatus Saccharimonadales bacterium]
MTSRPKLVVFDMDGTLIKGRLIEVISRKYDLSKKVVAIQSDTSIVGYKKTELIASLLKGIRADEIVQAVDSIPIMKNADKIVTWFKNNGYRTGIITDSYTIAAEVVAKKLEIEFYAANELRIENGLLTGEIKMPLGWEKINCQCKISICKKYHLNYYSNLYGVNIKDTIAIGDTRGDICMIKHAGLGIAFMPKDQDIISQSKNLILNPDLNEILNYM